MHNKCQRRGRCFQSPRSCRWCSGACHVAAHRVIRAKRENATRERLARQSAVLASDAAPIVLASLAREAQLVLGCRKHCAGGG